MTDTYHKVEIDCSDEDLQEVFIAALGDWGFESFQQNEAALLAFVASRELAKQDKKALDVFLTEMVGRFGLSFFWEEIPTENWNKTWEDNFQPIAVGDKVYIRGTFHEAKPGFAHELVIDPKMAFGTGHHATTYLCLATMAEMDLEGRSVLDLGCGTGILALFAEKKKARPIVAVDNDPVCIANTEENCTLNQCAHIRFYTADVYGLEESGSFDLVVANINRNVLLADIPAIAGHLKANGALMLSGFYQNDVEAISAVAKTAGLRVVNEKSKDDWVCLVLERN